MNVFWPLYRREAGAYFNNPSAYIISVVFLLITGYFFAQPLFLINQASLRTFIELMPLLLSIFVPAVTMRHFSEEFKAGTIELLLTSPARDWEILLSKFLAAVTLLCVVFALTLVYPATIGALGRPDWGGVAGAYAGLALTGALLASAGMFASSLTRNQVVAFIVGFLFSFALYLIGKVSAFVPLWLTPVTDYLGMDSHLDNIGRGILDSRDMMYYLSGTGLFLFLTQVRLWLLRSD